MPHYKSPIDLIKSISRIFIQNNIEKIYTDLLRLLLQEIRGTHGMVSTIDSHHNMHCFTLARDSGDQEIQQSLLLEDWKWKNLWPGIIEKETIKINNRREAHETDTAENSIIGSLFFQGDFLGVLEIQGAEEAYTRRDADDLKLIIEYITPIQHAWRAEQLKEEEKTQTYQALRESERKYKTIFESTKDMIYMTDARGTILNINQGGALMLGFHDPKALEGTNILSYHFTPAEKPYFVDKIAEDGHVQNHEVILNRRGQEEPFFGLEDTVFIPSEGKQPAFYLSIIKDITQRVKDERAVMQKSMEISEANNRLRDYQAQLEKKNRLLQESNDQVKKARDQMVQQEKMASIGQLAAGIAHEINNPMGFVKSNYKTLQQYFESFEAFFQQYKSLCPQESPPQEDEITVDDMIKAQDRLHQLYEEEEINYLLQDTRDIFSETESGFQRIMAIVSNLKDFSRIDKKGDIGSYDLNAAIESTLVIARNEYKYSADIRKDLGEVEAILCNGNEINQVILNLIVNAAQAIREEDRKSRGTITIKTRQRDDKVYCLIGDDGPGIPEVMMDQIFNPFFTTKKVGEGTGLGLSISYNIIVNNHGGQLTAKRRKPKGTVFTIELPRGGTHESE